MLQRLLEILDNCVCFPPVYLAAFVLVVIRRSDGVTRRAQLLVMVLGALQAGVVTAAVRRGEVRVPQVLGPRTLRTGVEEPFALGLLHANLGVPHPSSYLHRRGEVERGARGVSASKAALQSKFGF